MMETFLKRKEDSQMGKWAPGEEERRREDGAGTGGVSWAIDCRS